MPSKNPAQKGELTSHTVRQLGRTRIEIVPRSASSLFVYWEVANTSPDPGDLASDPRPMFKIHVLREADDASVAAFETDDRVAGRIVDVEPAARYYAVLTLVAPRSMRLARSSTIAGTLHGDAPVEFVTVSPTDAGLSTSPTITPSSGSVDWSWTGAGSSPK